MYVYRHIVSAVPCQTKHGEHVTLRAQCPASQNVFEYICSLIMYIITSSCSAMPSLYARTCLQGPATAIHTIRPKHCHYNISQINSLYFGDCVNRKSVYRCDHVHATCNYNAELCRTYSCEPFLYMYIISLPLKIVTFFCICPSCPGSAPTRLYTGFQGPSQR